MDKINAEVFLTVAETGSFRKAADQMGYTQAGISYIISSMEELTGLVLFVREHNGVRLSPEGEELLTHMRQLKNWEWQFWQTVDELKGLEKGTVRVQIFDSISIHWIPDILQKFHKDYPHIRVELISEEDSVRAEEMILNGEVDVGFFPTKVNAKMDVFPLREEKLMVALPPGHPIAQKEKFPIAALGELPYIGMKYDDHIGITRIFKKHKIKPHMAFCMDNDYAAMAMVNKGHGYAIFPELLLLSVPYKMEIMDFDKPQTRIVSMATADYDSCSKASRMFIHYTRKWVSDIYGKPELT